MLLCIEQGILFLDTVDIKIKAHNAFNAMFVNTVNTVALTQHLIQSTMRCENCIDSVAIYSIDDMVEKPRVLAFQNFLQIENPLNIKKVMGRNVWMYFVSTVST